MKNIRQNVFETNSSSTHSFSISSNTDGIYQTLDVDDDGSITFVGGDFGWEFRKYNDAKTKCNYAATLYDQTKADPAIFENVVKEHTGAKKIIYNFGTDDSYYGIDHQSVHGNDWMYDSFKMKNWLFSSESWLYLGNDNEDMHPNFKDLNTNYKFVFKLGKFEVGLYKKPTNSYLKKIVTQACHEQIFSDEEIPRHISFDEAIESGNNEAYFTYQDKMDRIKENGYFFSYKENGPDSFMDLSNNNIVLFQRKFDYDTRKDVYGKQKTVTFTIEKYK